MGRIRAGDRGLIVQGRGREGRNKEEMEGTTRTWMEGEKVTGEEGRGKVRKAGTHYSLFICYTNTASLYSN